MRYLILGEVLELYAGIMGRSGGLMGLRDMGALESALAQPRMTFGGKELYPTLEEKASALGFSLIKNHPFVDGNKRIGHAVMETFLVLNGLEIQAEPSEQEMIILKLASGELEREPFTAWVRKHLVPVANA